ncbi:MAG: CPBP family intramembrane glutamic endopeptidase [Candidatus Hodarchaeota archaeon]
MEERRKNKEKKENGLSFDEHLQVLVNYFLVFMPYTIFVVITKYFIKPVNLYQETILWVILTGVEIIIVVIIQATWDTFTQKDKLGMQSHIKTRFLAFGFQKKTSSGTMIKDTLILLFCIVVPLDLLSYMIPGCLQYVANSPVGLRFKDLPLINYLVLGFIYNMLTGVKEEFVFRGYISTRLHEKGKRFSSWFISSIFFGLAHFDFFAPDLTGPLVWFASATLVGFLFAGYSLSTNQVLPLMFAHGLSNYISAFSIWMFHSTSGFSTMPINGFLLVFYVPMVLFGCLLAIFFRKRIKEGINALKNLSRETSEQFVAADIGIILIMIFVFYIIGLFGMQI